MVFHLFTYFGCAPTDVLALRDKNTDIQWRGNPQMGAHFSAVFAKSPYRVEQLHERRGRVLCAVWIECVGVMLWVMYYREEWSIFVGTMSIYCQTNRKHRMGVRVAITRARMRVLVQLEHIFSAFVRSFVCWFARRINKPTGRLSKNRACCETRPPKGQFVAWSARVICEYHEHG